MKTSSLIGLMNVADYHTFTVPYGVKFNAKNIENLCYTRDLLMHVEWNQPKEREVYLHRHSAFFGRGLLRLLPDTGNSGGKRGGGEERRS
ncbi:hypothetical protein QBC42DRAFT_288420 [Cladorrhinum samala]|uniref:Uncharacterized protein n=1 Tax=Cladorrhinum samala TaxID=585594 RepID=A0AAV9HJR7_9PEZI|nr:hypothetical protein QBC42DRAFT_288420 [Cladorrhinum samala]